MSEIKEPSGIVVSGSCAKELCDGSSAWMHTPLRKNLSWAEVAFGRAVSCRCERKSDNSRWSKYRHALHRPITPRINSSEAEMPITTSDCSTHRMSITL